MKNFLTPEQIKIFLDALEKKDGRKTIICDLDGVVADFEPAAQNWCDKNNILLQDFLDKKMYRDLEGFYLGLDLIPGAKEAIMELDKVYEIIFVSAPSWGNKWCFTEKRIWLEKHFGKWATKRLDLSFHKGHYFGHYIIDDRTKYGVSDFIGEHIMYGSEDYKNWAAVNKRLLK